ncbi:hypothetical protein LEMLEM_LOCUS22934, partial [Lemmus lemmus]
MRQRNSKNGLRDLYGREDCKGQRTWRTPRKQDLLDIAGWMHRDCGSMLRTWTGMHQIESSTERSSHKLPSLTQKLSSTDNH